MIYQKQDFIYRSSLRIPSMDLDQHRSPQTCVEQDLAQPEPFKGNLGPQNALQRQNPSFLASYNALGSPRKTAPVAFRGFKGVKNANFIAFFGIHRGLKTDPS